MPKRVMKLSAKLQTKGKYKGAYVNKQGLGNNFGNIYDFPNNRWTKREVEPKTFLVYTTNEIDKNFSTVYKELSECKKELKNLKKTVRLIQKKLKIK